MRFTDQITDKYGRIWLLYRDERPDRYIRLMYCTTPVDISVTVNAYKTDMHKDEYPVHVMMFWDKQTVTFQSYKSAYRGVIYDLVHELSQTLEHTLPENWDGGNVIGERDEA